MRAALAIACLLGALWCLTAAAFAWLVTDSRPGELPEDDD